jgi:hypothetical protein
MYAKIRMLALAVAIVLVLTIPRLAWFSLFYAILFAHYVFAAYAGRRRFREFAARKGWAAAAALCGLLPVLLYLGVPKLIKVYFGFHFASSEAYAMRSSARAGRSEPWERWTRGFQFALTFLAFCLVFRVRLPVPLSFLQIAAIAAGGAYAVALWFSRARATRAERMADLVPDFTWLAAGLKPASWFLGGNWNAGIFYHLIEWMFLPFLRSEESAFPALSRETAAMAATAAAFFSVSPVVLARFMPEPIASGLWREQAILWGYVHITLSLVVSEANPPWINRLVGQRGFRPAGSRAEAEMVESAG